MRETHSYWFDVQKPANFKQLFCATCRSPHSYLTYVQFAAGIMSYFLFHGIKLQNILVKKYVFLPYRLFPVLCGDVHFISSYGVYISLLIRFARIYHNVSDVNKAAMFLG